MEWVENILAKSFGVFLLTKHVTHGGSEEPFSLLKGPLS